MEGGVASKVPGITSASRYIQPVIEDDTNDTRLNNFLKELYKFKEYFWKEFIETKQSQHPDVVDEYIILLKEMYNCLLYNKDCKQLPYQTYNSSNISLSALMNTIDRIQSEYWLKRILIQFPFTLNMNNILGNK